MWYLISNIVQFGIVCTVYSQNKYHIIFLLAYCSIFDCISQINWYLKVNTTELAWHSLYLHLSLPHSSHFISLTISILASSKYYKVCCLPARLTEVSRLWNWTFTMKLTCRQQRRRPNKMCFMTRMTQTSLSGPVHVRFWPKTKKGVGLRVVAAVCVWCGEVWEWLRKRVGGSASQSVVSHSLTQRYSQVSWRSRQWKELSENYKLLKMPDEKQQQKMKLIIRN